MPNIAPNFAPRFLTNEEANQIDTIHATATFDKRSPVYPTPTPGTISYRRGSRWYCISGVGGIPFPCYNPGYEQPGYLPPGQSPSIGYPGEGSDDSDYGSHDESDEDYDGDHSDGNNGGNNGGTIVPGVGGGSGGNGGSDSGNNGGNGSNGSNGGNGGNGGNDGNSRPGGAFAGDGFPLGAKIALGVGIPVLVILIILLLCCCLRRKRSQQESQMNDQAAFTSLTIPVYAGAAYTQNDSESQYSFETDRISTVIHDPAVKETIVHAPSQSFDEKEYEEVTTTTTKRTGLFAALAGGAAAMGLYKANKDEEKLDDLTKTLPEEKSESGSEEEIIEEKVITSTKTETIVPPPPVFIPSKRTDSITEKKVTIIEPVRTPSPVRQPSPLREASPPRISSLPEVVEPEHSEEESITEEIIETVTVTENQDISRENTFMSDPPSDNLTSPDKSMSLDEVDTKIEEVINNSISSREPSFDESESEEIITTEITKVTTTVAYNAINELNKPQSSIEVTEIESQPGIGYSRSRAPLTVDENGRRALPPPPRPPPTSHVATHVFIPTFEDELKIESGDLIGIEQDLGDGWCIGQNITKGRTRGLFPSDFVTPIRSGPSQRVALGNMRDRSDSSSSGEDNPISPTVPKRKSLEPHSFDPSMESFL